jgi:hypothetical protein
VNFLQNILTYLAQISPARTGWGSWVGVLVITAILSIWFHISLIKGEFLPLDDGHIMVILSVFVINGLKLNKK